MNKSLITGYESVFSTAALINPQEMVPESLVRRSQAFRIRVTIMTETFLCHILTNP